MHHRMHNFPCIMTHGCMQSSHTQKVMYLLQQINVVMQIIRRVIKETLYTDRHTECVLRGIEGRGREKERERERERKRRSR